MAIFLTGSKIYDFLDRPVFHQKIGAEFGLGITKHFLFLDLLMTSRMKTSSGEHFRDDLFIKILLS